HRARCTHLQTQPGRIQPIDSSHLAGPDGWPGRAAKRHACGQQSIRRRAHLVLYIIYIMRIIERLVVKIQ
ncbi:hypothetical protein OMF39_21355, partial [Bordetella pertussis]